MIFHCEHDSSGILVRKGEPQIATAWHALADLGRREAHRRAAVDRHELGADLQVQPGRGRVRSSDAPHDALPRRVRIQLDPERAWRNAKFELNAGDATPSVPSVAVWLKTEGAEACCALDMHNAV